MSILSCNAIKKTCVYCCIVYTETQRGLSKLRFFKKNVIWTLINSSKLYKQISCKFLDFYIILVKIFLWMSMSAEMSFIFFFEDKDIQNLIVQ